MYLALLVIFLQCSELYSQKRVFTFNTVDIKVQPSVKVKNGAPLSITCHADISKSTDFQLKHNFTFFKDGKLVFMTVSDKRDARYEIPVARSSDTGDYECTVEAGGKTKSSNSLHVWVTGMTKPILTAEKKEVLEGEVVKLRCELPEEVPPLYFFFRKMKMNSTPKEKSVFESQRNFSVVEFPVEEGDNILQFDCFARRNVKLEFESSEHSKKTLVTVREPFIKPTLNVKPSSNITEGDRIQIECSTVVARMRDIEIILQKNKTILNSVRDEKLLKYSAVATLEDSGEYQCKVEQGRASKTTKLNIVVSELFPKPILAASVIKLDENKELTLSCSINGFQKANFSILRKNSNADIWLKNSKNLTMRVNVNDTGSYICKAEVKGIVKESKPVTINVYAPVSKPTLSVVSGLPEVVLGKSLLLICRSVMGTPPITFTFYKGNKIKETVVNDTYATFLDENIGQNDKGGYRCDAKNNHSSGMKTSNILNITVIVPIKNASLGSVPYGEVEDGSETVFLCSVKEGSWPIRFRIFRKTDREVLLFEKNENAHRVVWRREAMNRQDTGTYYCMASNRANVDVKSHPITISVILAAWQKGVIAAFVLILIAGAVTLTLWWLLCKKKKAKGPSMEMSGSALATNLPNEKLTRQHNDGDYYSGSGYIEDSENHMKSPDESKGPDLESAEVEYTEVEVSTLDPHRAPVQKGTETVYSEIRKANNDSVENRHSRLQGHPDAT
ncbi:platelet endothelial cell adhesion molecule isoform X6 [Falco biarmicus]|uniref:platelet endothelial cell adhesion molecule isoform X2 n=1 Tax=Falco peregrinus TaxID=8954 RepID=UPI00038700D1|nr:platelet endothelial cell adhesion molecule isoform X2 [Falco peregrinus]XP_014137008.2 platelet endothelial cell adhesion molecule isoform X5 [Falco cherrug]XP_037261571.1 platelet endothelial cell adhesion molecule isoform X5 [Falco rusticolus]XP_056199214.1 platelet endothelial cell adhesion molecule isoform X6 [Falco biarmicus]